MAAESGQQRAHRFRELAAHHEAEAAKYRRMAEACEKGNAGELQIASLLDTLDGAGWRVLNDRYKSHSSPANLDHVVIGPGGVAVIDAKNWSGGQIRFDARGMAFGRWRKDDELRSGASAAAVVAQHVRAVSEAAPTQGVLAFTTDVGLSHPVHHQDVVLLHSEHLLPWLVAQPKVLTPQQVHQIASSLDAALPPRDGPRQPLTLRGVPFPSRRLPAPRNTTVRRRPPPRRAGPGGGR